MSKKAHIEKAKREMVFIRDGYRCVYCGGTGMLGIDHIHPESEGGVLDFRNLATCCRRCNSAKGTRPVAEFLNTPEHAAIRSAWGPDDYKRLSDCLERAAEWFNDTADKLQDEGEERFGALPFEVVLNGAIS